VEGGKPLSTDDFCEDSLASMKTWHFAETKIEKIVMGDLSNEAILYFGKTSQKREVGSEAAKCSLMHLGAYFTNMNRWVILGHNVPQSPLDNPWVPAENLTLMG